MIAKPLAIFDIDHTLLRVNSHYEFAEYFLRQRSLPRYLLFRFAAWEPVRKGLSYFHGDDIRRRFSAFLFKPYPKLALSECADRLVEQEFSNWVNSAVLKLLEKARKSEFEVVMASATLDVIADAIAKKLQLKAVSSEYKDGRIFLDITGRKLQLIRQRYPGQRIGLFVSDNKEDISELPEKFVYVVGEYLFLMSSEGAIDKEIYENN